LKEKRFTTSKIILYGGNFLCDVVIGIALYGWLHGALDASSIITDMIIVKGVIYGCYYAKAALENYSKGQFQINDLPLSKINNLITILQGILNGFQGGNMASASNSILSSLQQIVQNEQVKQQMDQSQNINGNAQIDPNDNSISSSMGECNIEEQNLNNKQTDNQNAYNKGDS